MSRLTKAILIPIGILGLLALVALFALNFYVQSPDAQARIQAELSRSLGVPLEITKTSVSPWSGLHMSGITVPGEGRMLLEANSFSARYKLFPILRGKLIFYELVLDSPKIVWAQDAEGNWRLPMMPEETALRKNEESAREKAGMPEPAAPESKTAEEDDKGLDVVIDGLVVRNGSITLLNQEQRPMAAASAVEMKYTTLSKDEVKGTMTIGQLVWNDAMIFTEVTTPFRYDDGELYLSDVIGKLAGGDVRGKLQLKTTGDEAPFKVDLEFANLDMVRLTSDAGWQPGRASGLLSGGLVLHGSSRDMAQAQGKGRLSLANGAVRIELLQAIGGLLQMPDLAELRLQEARAEFRVQDEKAFIEPLLLSASDLRLTAKGYTRVDGKVALKAQLAIADSRLRALPGFARDFFAPSDVAGWRGIDFDITGRTDSMKTNLFDRVVGDRLGQQATDLISSIFGGGKKKDDDKEKEKKKKKDKEKEKEREREAAAAAGREP